MENQSVNISEHLLCAGYFPVSKTGKDPYCLEQRAGETGSVINK